MVGKPPTLNFEQRQLILKHIEKHPEKGLTELFADQSLRPLLPRTKTERSAFSQYRCRRLRDRKSPLLSAQRKYVQTCLEHKVLINTENLRLRTIESELEHLNMSMLESKDEEYYNKLLNARKKPTALPMKSTESNPFSSSIAGDTEESNNLGKKIVLHLHGGLIFVLLWIDAKVDAGSYELKICDDGYGVIERKKKPAPSSARELIEGLYPSWAHNETNFVVKALNEEISRQAPEPNEWEEQTIIVFQEEVMRDFYDMEGNTVSTGRYYQSEDGRQMLSFFLQTVASQKKQTEAVVFEMAANSGLSVDLDMDDHVTVSNSELLEEVDARMMAQAARLVRQAEESEQRMKDQMAQQMNMLSQMMTQQMGEQFAKLQMNSQQQQHLYPDNSSPVFPDQAGSS